MQDFIEVTGMVLKAVPVLDTDKRITILTKERGKVGAFARGAKRQGSRFMAATEPFVYGTFRLYEGKNAYNLSDVKVDQYFETLREDFESVFYAMYFADVADYYTRENNDEKEMLKLLYMSLKALSVSSIPNELVQYIFEMKTLVVNGEFPGVLSKHPLSESAVYTIQYIQNSPIEKLYTFTVSDEVLAQLERECEVYRKKYIGHNFKSLEILQNCRLKN
ncbi:MAG: DNA repair protein RecO [Lachnospiraceae bacterium]|nr:DNA repair protein RecO [Lachnospiraceae bacterium]